MNNKFILVFIIIVFISLSCTLTFTSLFVDATSIITETWIAQEQTLQGNGAAITPYQINSADELCYGLNTYKNKSFTLNCDISLKNKLWIPVGTERDPFSGSIDGNGFRILDLCVETNDVPGGLIAYALGASLKNIVINGGFCSSSMSAGSLIGISRNSTIYNCHNNGCKVYSFEHGDAGGIVGYCHRDANNNVLSYCSNNAEVLSYASISGWGAEAGGIYGYGKASVSQCFNNGEVVAYCKNSNSLCYAGGIVGENYTSINDISECFNTGIILAGENSNTVLTYSINSKDISINVTTSNNSYAGGIAGSAYTVISNCYNIGSIMSYSTKQRSMDTFSSCEWTSLTRCGYNNVGTDTSVVFRRGYTAEYAYSGGIVGYLNNDCSIAQCYNSGSYLGGTYNEVVEIRVFVRAVGSWKKTSGKTSKTVYIEQAGEFVNYNFSADTKFYSYPICGYSLPNVESECYSTIVIPHNLTINYNAYQDKVLFDSYNVSTYTIINEYSRINNEQCNSLDDLGYVAKVARVTKPVSNPHSFGDLHLSSFSSSKFTLSVNKSGSNFGIISIEISCSCIKEDPSNWRVTKAYPTKYKSINSIDYFNPSVIEYGTEEILNIGNKFGSDKWVINNDKLLLKCFFWEYNTSCPF